MKRIWLLLFLMAATVSRATTITNLALTAQSGSTATIRWTTDVPASTQLFYGVGSPSNQTPIDHTLATSHTVTLTGVQNASTYSYYAVSVDVGNNSATSPIQVFTVCTGAGPNNGLTNVQGTVNNYYEYGVYTFTWVSPAGYSITPTVCGQPLTTTFTGNLDQGASLSLQMPDTQQIVPSQSQWRLTVAGVNGSIGSFNITQAITPQGNNLTLALQLAAQGNLLHVWYDPFTNTFYPPVGGGGGGSGTVNAGTAGQIAYYAAGGTAVNGLSLDVGNVIDQEGVLESGGVFTAQNGCIVWGDSNSAGVGVPSGYGWAALIAAYLNVSTCSGTANAVPTTVPGNTSGDAADNIYAGASPSSLPNPINFLQDTTNNLKTESNVTPIAAHKISYTSQMAAAIAHLATSIDDNYLPVQQPVTMNGSQTVTVANNVAAVTLNNNFQMGQKLLISGCATTLLNNLNFIQVASSSATGFTFSYNNASLGTTYANETCTFAPSNPWSLSGTWTPLQSFMSIGFTSGASQGTSYLAGNVLTLACSVQNAQFRVANIAADSDLGLTVDVTASGGVITAATLNNPGTVGIINGTYLIVNAGDGTAIVRINTISGTLTPTSVTLMSGGSTGYTTGTNVGTLSHGRLSTNALKQIRVGAGCPSSSTFVLTMACSNGTASSCGQLATFNNFTGPNVLSTSASSSMTLPAIQSGDSSVVMVPYMVGPDYGGSFQLSIDGAPACTDSFTGTSTIVESFQGTDSFAYGPANWASGDTVQLAMCQVTPNAAHTYTITATNSGSNNTGIVGLIVPPASRYTGTNVPNVFVGGAVPLQNNSQPTCGLTDPRGCQVTYSQWLEQLVQQMGPGLGLNVKYWSNLNVNGSIDFCDTFPVNTLQWNRVCNSTNGLHGSQSFHQKVAANALASAKALPATPKDLGGNAATFRTSFALAQGVGTGLFQTNLAQPNSGYTGRLIAYSQSQQPFSPCWYNIVPNLDVTKLPSALTCPFEFVDNGSGFDSFNLNATSLASNNVGQTSPTQKIVASLFNNGVYISSFNGGSGYSGTGTLTSTGGTCTTQPTFTITQTSGALNPQPLTTGICTVAPSGFTLAGFTGGSGFTVSFGLGTETTLLSQTPGTGYSGSGTATTVGGTCTIFPTLSASLAGNGVVVALTNAPICTVVPGGVYILSSSGGTGYGGTGTLTASGGTCSIQPAFTITQSGGVLTPVVASAGRCSVAPTAFTLAGFTGGSGFMVSFGAGVQLSGFTGGTGFAANFIQPNGAIQTTWNMLAGTTNSGASLSARLLIQETTRGPSPAAPIISLWGPNADGFNFKVGGTIATQSATFDDTSLTAARSYLMPDVSGTLMAALTTIGTSGAATFINGTLNIPQYSGGGAGVASINAVTGAFTFNGAGVSCTTTTCTFSGGGSTGFASLTSGTNNTAAMIVGTGGSLSAAGSGTITATAVPASALTGGTLAAGVTGSSLTGVGTIATGVWQGTIIGALYGGTGINTSASTGCPSIASGTWSVVACSTGNTTSTSLTTNTLPKASGANSIVNSLFTDTGTAGTYAGSGGFSAPVVTVSGAANGALNLQANGSGAAAPAASNVQITVPNAVTAYALTLPNAAPGASGSVQSTATSGIESWALLPITQAAVSHQFMTSYTAGTGVFTQAQPTFADLAAGTVGAAATFPGGDLFAGGVNTQTGTSYTFVSGDGGKFVSFRNASSVAVTLPQATTTGFTSGFFMHVVNLGAGTVTITPTTSTINAGASLALATNQGTFIESDGTNYTATVPAAGGGGAVSSVSNSDGSLTVSPTTGAVTASLNTGHANTFTATQIAPLLLSQGTAQTSGNITLTGWGSGAAVSAVSGFSQRFRFTITAGTSPSANPTIAATFPATYPAAPVCMASQTGGTGAVADLASGTETTTATGTLIWLSLPVNASTYVVTVDCR